MPLPLKIRNSIFIKLYLLIFLVFVIVSLAIHFSIMKRFKELAAYQFKVKVDSEVELLVLTFKRDLKDYNYSGIYSTVNTLLKSDPDLQCISVYEFSPSNKLIHLYRKVARHLPHCKGINFDSPCYYREVRLLSSSPPIYAEVTYSTERLVFRLSEIKKRLLIVEIFGLLLLFSSFVAGYLLLRKRTLRLVELLQNWRAEGLKDHVVQGNDEFSFIESNLAQMYQEIELEKTIDENLLAITSLLLQLLISTDDEKEFIGNLEKILRRILNINFKVIKGDGGIEGCVYTVSLLNNKDIVLCFEEPIPEQLLNILVNIVDVIFLAFREKVEKEELFFQTITALANAIDATSPWTKGHSQRVAEISVLIGKELGLSNEELEKLKIAGILHDIGKIGIDKSILDKPSKLTPEEYEEIKKHPVIGYELLKPISLLKDVLPAILYHHERCDGSGYPEGLVCEEIPLYAKIVAVADVIEAMTAERPYKKSWPLKDVLNYLLENSGRLFDPKVVNAALKASSEIERLLGTESL